ncbi:MAG: type II toxin-antitoxin system Phd/YefM family antitoxin [Lautropia sp.]|nr:type II toxin-antitoxin system Phd/YefM family antitoxin [Lautropia sp.]
MHDSSRYQAKPISISYLKANAAKVLAQLAESKEPLVITQNGKAKAVLQDISSYERTQETLALLKLLALGQKDVEAGHVTTANTVIERLRTGANIIDLFGTLEWDGD